MVVSSLVEEPVGSLFAPVRGYNGSPSWLSDRPTPPEDPRDTFEITAGLHTPRVGAEEVCGARPESALTRSFSNLVTLLVSPAHGSLEQGDIIYFSALGVFTDGRREDLSRLVTWSCDDGCLRISNAPGERGQALGLWPGSVWVRARLGSVKSQPAIFRVRSGCKARSPHVARAVRQSLQLSAGLGSLGVVVARLSLSYGYRHPYRRVGGRSALQALPMGWATQALSYAESYTRRVSTRREVDSR